MYIKNLRRYNIMKFALNFDTSKMTKEDLLDAQWRLQTALSAVSHTLKTLTQAEHRHLGTSCQEDPTEI